MTDKRKNQLKTVAILGGEVMGFSPEFRRDAGALGALLGRNGFDLVYDGTAGLGGLTARSALEHGGKVTGIITAAFRRAADYTPLDGAGEVVTRNRAACRAKMLKQADAWLILPGGVGVLQAQAEILSLLDRQIAARSAETIKPVVILDTNGVYQPFKAQLRSLTAEGFILPGRGTSVYFAENPARVIAAFNALNENGIDRAREIADAYAAPIAKITRDLKCG